MTVTRTTNERKQQTKGWRTNFQVSPESRHYTNTIYSSLNNNHNNQNTDDDDDAMNGNDDNNRDNNRDNNHEQAAENLLQEYNRFHSLAGFATLMEQLELPGRNCTVDSILLWSSTATTRIHI